MYILVLNDSICFFKVAVWLRMVAILEMYPISSEECFGRTLTI